MELFSHSHLYLFSLHIIVLTDKKPSSCSETKILAVQKLAEIPEQQFTQV